MKKSSNQALIKDNICKITLCGLFLFVLGLMIGVSISSDNSTSLQGSIFNLFNRASRSNASWSNASWSSTSWANASWSSTSWTNASWTNASSSSISANDNILYLQSLKVKTAEANPLDKVYIDMQTTGATVSAASITFEDSTTSSVFTASLVMESAGYYIVVPKNVQTGNYKITNVLLVGRNSDYNSFTKQYSSNRTGTNISNYQFGDVISINNQSTASNEEISPITLKSLIVKSDTSSNGSKVNITYEADQKLTKLKLKFISTTGEELTTYVKSLDSNSYFEIPSTLNTGVYELVMATLTSDKTTTIYSTEYVPGVVLYNFDVTLQIENNETIKTYVYNSEELTEKVITDIYKAKNGITIKINADSNPIINSELFNVIKRKNKKIVISYNDNEMIFNGKDITDAKSIDVSMNSSVITSDMSVGNYVKEGILLDFASNGNLPGTASVRIKTTDDMSNLLNKKVFVYYFDPSINKFTYIDEITQNSEDDYYEFDITHTSSYILVNEKLDDSLVVTQTDGNKIIQDNKTLWILVALSAVVIIIVTLIIIKEVKKKKDSKNSK